MYQRILVPVDGSATSRQGLAEAISLARLTQGRIRIAHVLDEPFMALGADGFVGNPGDLLALVEEAGQAILDEALAIVRAAGIDCDGVSSNTFEGRVCECVVAAAREWPADLIVIGTHGRRGAGRLLLGSDAEQILRLAPTPVLLVRAPLED